MKSRASILLASFAALVSTTCAAGATAFTYTTIDPPPGFLNSLATGINDSGQVVGAFRTVGLSQGFLDSNGVITPIVVPSSVHATVPFDINNHGQIVGSFVDDPNTGFSRGFLYANGAYTTLDVPGAIATTATGINDLGQVVGNYLGASDASSHGFIYANGTYTTFDVPSAFGNYTQPAGINDLGQIVGYFSPANSVAGCAAGGFLDTGGVFSLVNVPGAVCTQAIGINNSGEIVGRFDDGSIQSFIDKDGVITTLDIPGLSTIQAFGINDHGQIVGEFGNHSLAFVATPVPSSVPEPATWAMLLIGFGAIGFTLRRGSGMASRGRAPGGPLTI